MISVGPAKATIVSHDIQDWNGKDFVLLQLAVDDNPISARIYLTPKSMSIARQQLGRCGFDIGKQGLDALVANPTLLAGKVIDVEIEDYKGRLQAKILAREPSKPADKIKLASLTASLRAAKNDDDGEDMF